LLGSTAGGVGGVGVGGVGVGAAGGAMGGVGGAMGERVVGVGVVPVVVGQVSSEAGTKSSWGTRYYTDAHGTGRRFGREITWHTDGRIRGSHEKKEMW
jgi:hypothetical protein